MDGEFSTYLWLLLASCAAGVVNALAGGGTLLTFPALTAVVSEVLANGTSTVALMPGSFASVAGYRRELQRARKWALVLLPPSIAGGLVGAMLVVRWPEQFRTLVPWLILSATALFLVQPLVSRYVRHEHRPMPVWMLVSLQFVIAVYGGYFGAGIGILMLATLGLMGLTDIHEMNAVKTVQAVVINVMAAAVFIVGQNVVWPFALVMAVGAIAGGFLGAHYGRLLSRTLVRGIVVGIGISLSSYYFWKRWGG